MVWLRSFARVRTAIGCEFIEWSVANYFKGFTRELEEYEYFGSDTNRVCIDLDFCL